MTAGMRVVGAAAGETGCAWPGIGEGAWSDISG